MTEEENRRLEAIEATLRQINQRLDRIEGVPQQPAKIVPPPIIRPRAEPDRPTHQPEREAPAYSIPTARPTAPVDVDEIEYKIGTTGLLKGGAVVVIVALLYLVALAISRGYITLKVQFIGEILLCLTFIGVGIIKRDLKEDFGQIMIGVGTCGLYLSFAGAHVYKNLYSSETLIGLFAGLSLLTIGFSALRSSKAFLGLGLLGGLISSVLPLTEQNVPISVILHLLILIPALVITVRNRWEDMAIATSTMAGIALIPVYFAEGEWIWRLAGAQFAALLCAVGYVFSTDREKTISNFDLAPFILIVAGVGGASLDLFSHPAWTVLIFAAAVLAAAQLAGTVSERARNYFLFSAVCLSVVVAPTAMSALSASYLYAALSIAMSAAVLVWPRVAALLALAWIDFIFALIGFFIVGGDQSPQLVQRAELPFLLALIANGIVVSCATYRGREQSEKAFTLASIIVFAFYARASILVFADFPLPARHLEVFIPFLTVSLGMFIVSRLKQWQSAMTFGWISLCIATASWVWLALELQMSRQFEGALLLSLIFGFVAGAWGSWPLTKEDQRETVLAVTGYCIAALVARGVYIALGPPLGPFSSDIANVWAAFVINFASVAFVLRWRFPSFHALTWFATLAASGFVLAPAAWHNSFERVETPLLIIAMGAVLLTGYAQVRQYQALKDTIVAIEMAWIWGLLSALSQIVLIGGMKPTASLTAFWISYAVLLMILGFALRAQWLRFGSFVVFAATIAKVFMLDLSNLDSAIRVAILMALGIGMLGAGYWYVRQRTNLEGTKKSDPEESLPSEPD